MKTLFGTIITSIFFSLTLTAQYQPFLEQTDWFMVKIDFGQKSYFWYNVTGDTVINNLDYKTILRDSTDIYWVREDTSTQRVYIREAFYQTDFLAYDFSLVPGGPTTIFYPGGGVFTFTCDSVDNVHIMNTSRKRLWVTGSNGGPNTIQMQWVEGLGNYGYLDGLFYLFEQGLQSDPLYQTVCSYQDSSQVFYDSVYALNQNIICPNNLNTGVITSLEEPKSSGIHTFNYKNNKLYLSLSNGLIQRADLFDINGRLLQSVNLAPSFEVEISLEQNLPTSIYIIRVHTLKHTYSRLFSSK
jgi:hypothetical protein